LVLEIGKEILRHGISIGYTVKIIIKINVHLFKNRSYGMSRLFTNKNTNQYVAHKELHTCYIINKLFEVNHSTIKYTTFIHYDCNTRKTNAHTDLSTL
jgi:hypothetical protein